MSAFINKADYRAMLKVGNLDAILENDDTLLEEAESTAVSQIKDYLFKQYDTEAIFAKTGTERHSYLVRCCCNIVIKILWERLALDTPERVTNNYNDTLEYLERLADGKMTADLPAKIIDVENATPYTVSRWGSSTKRSHG